VIPDIVPKWHGQGVVIAASIGLPLMLVFASTRIYSKCYLTILVSAFANRQRCIPNEPGRTFGGAGLGHFVLNDLIGSCNSFDLSPGRWYVGQCENTMKSTFTNSN
jgi:hypothetical protein